MLLKGIIRSRKNRFAPLVKVDGEERLKSQV
ncbi:MAG: hypothetical protein PWR10_403 [Halanaerobiales bacterium]|nr:hypothetical protein [Halanaerobiales bacterium]